MWFKLALQKTYCSIHLESQKPIRHPPPFVFVWWFTTFQKNMILIMGAPHASIGMHGFGNAATPCARSCLVVKLNKCFMQFSFIRHTSWNCLICRHTDMGWIWSNWGVDLYLICSLMHFYLTAPNKLATKQNCAKVLRQLSFLCGFWCFVFLCLFFVKQ